MDFKTIAFSFMLAGMPACTLAAQDVQPAPLVLKYGATHLDRRQDDSMKRFRSNRLGAFIHWGLYAIPGGSWNGVTYGGAAEWLQASAGIPSKDWMALMKQWNPQHFDPKTWARMFKDMGVRYVKITTKHHEGFCLWPSKYSKYTVAQTPYKKDLLGQMIKALDEEGIDVHLYYSILDWNHPDYRASIDSPEDSVAFDRFMKFTENQLRELCQRYPSVRDFWFDGTWDNNLTQRPGWTAHLEKMLKEMHPGITVNSRLRADDYGKRDFDSNGHLMGDYESGYERKLPDPVKDLRVTAWDWEACMTLPENQWGYHRDWSLSYVKTPVEVLERIVHAVSMGGNMVVNFGPQPDGDFRPEEKHMAEAIGQWMKRNGECIYGCDYAGLEKQDWGYYTRKDGTVYMVVFNEPFSHGLTVKVDKGKHVDNAAMLDGTALKVVRMAEGEYRISTPDTAQTEPYVVRLGIGE